jgi:hypothetical protein
VREAIKRYAMIIAFIKSNKLTSSTKEAENIALLTEYTQYNCGRPCSLLSDDVFKFVLYV